MPTKTEGGQENIKFFTSNSQINPASSETAFDKACHTAHACMKEFLPTKYTPRLSSLLFA